MCREPSPVGHVDADCGAAAGVRAAVGQLRLDWATVRGCAIAASALRHDHPRRRDLLDRRPGARSAAAARRAVSNSRRHGGRDQATQDRGGRVSRSAQRSCGRSSSGAAARTAGASPARASPTGASGRGRRCASSTRSCPARTNRAAATTSCCARSRTTPRWPRWRALDANGYRTHEFGDSMFIERGRPDRSSMRPLREARGGGGLRKKGTVPFSAHAFCSLPDGRVNRRSHGHPRTHSPLARLCRRHARSPGPGYRAPHCGQESQRTSDVPLA